MRFPACPLALWWLWAVVLRPPHASAECLVEYNGEEKPCTVECIVPPDPTQMPTCSTHKQGTSQPGSCHAACDSSFCSDACKLRIEQLLSATTTTASQVVAGTTTTASQVVAGTTTTASQVVAGTTTTASQVVAGTTTHGTTTVQSVDGSTATTQVADGTTTTTHAVEDATTTTNQVVKGTATTSTGSDSSTTPPTVQGKKVVKAMAFLFHISLSRPSLIFPSPSFLSLFYLA
ncbi:uncharacterized protein [Penaeus vannamei]|uniref:uncharacterized protein n=1 Tax=Penaeus vannamei TaxID=6689 RepID=UPI00387F72FA